MRRALLLLLLLWAGPALRAEDAASLFARGREQMRARDYAGAAATFEKCIGVAPTDSRHHQWFGRALGLQAQQAGLFKAMTSVGRIRAAFEKAVELDPSNLEAREDLFGFYLEAPGIAGGSKDKARAQIEEMRRRDPAFAAVLEGEYALAEKRLAEAKSAFSRAARLAPTRPAPLVSLADVLVREYRWEEAFSALDRALRADPKYPKALFEYGRVATMTGQNLDRGEALLRQYLALRLGFDDPTPATAQIRLGMIAEWRGNRAAARAEYEAALRLEPKNKEARLGIKRVSGS